MANNINNIDNINNTKNNANLHSLFDGIEDNFINNDINNDLLNNDSYFENIVNSNNSNIMNIDSDILNIFNIDISDIDISDIDICNVDISDINICNVDTSNINLLDGGIYNTDISIDILNNSNTNIINNINITNNSTLLNSNISMDDILTNNIDILTTSTSINNTNITKNIINRYKNKSINKKDFNISVLTDSILNSIVKKFNIIIPFNDDNMKKIEILEKINEIYKDNIYKYSLYKHIKQTNHIVFHFFLFIIECNELNIINLSDNFIYFEILQPKKFSVKIKQFLTNYEYDCENINIENIFHKNNFVMNNFGYHAHKGKKQNIYVNTPNTIFVNNILFTNTILSKEKKIDPLITTNYNIVENYFIYYYYSKKIVDKYMSNIINNLKLNTKQLIIIKRTVDLYHYKILSLCHFINDYLITNIKIKLTILFTINIIILFKIRYQNKTDKIIKNLNIMLFIINNINDVIIKNNNKLINQIIYNENNDYNNNNYKNNYNDDESINEHNVIVLFNNNINGLNILTNELLILHFECLNDIDINSIIFDVMYEFYHYNDNVNSITSNLLNYLKCLLNRFHNLDRNKISIYEMISVIESKKKSIINSLTNDDINNLTCTNNCKLDDESFKLFINKNLNEKKSNKKQKIN